MEPLSSRVVAPESTALPGPAHGVSWQRIERDDAAAVHALRREIGIVDHPSYIVNLDQIEADFDRRELDLGQDSALAVAEDGTPIAYGVSLLLPAKDTIVRVYLDGGVHPDHRRRGIGTALLGWQERRALQQLASSDLSLPGWIIADAAEQANSAMELFRAHDFEFRRWWLELGRDLSADIPEIPLDPDLRLVNYGPEWSEKTRQARNDSFRDHWGSQPNTVEEWVKRDGLSIARPDLSFLAVAPDEHGEEQVAAFVLSEVNELEWSQNGYSFGYIAYVGARRQWRGRKLAQALLARTLAAYREQGFERAVLDVDSESPTGALGLYEKLGFSTLNRSVSVVKEY